MRFYNMDGQEISQDEGIALLGSVESRRVAWDQIGRWEVSTVLLVIDHDFTGKGPPIIFETMVFPSNERARTCTKDAALAMHDQLTAAMRDEMRTTNDEDERAHGEGAAGDGRA